MSARSSQKPWPMKWVVVAIVVFIGAYTFITVRYRKAGPAHQPFHDAKERETVARLREAGYTRIQASAERPADPARTRAIFSETGAEVTDAPGGLPAELAETLLDKPKIPEGFASVVAPRGATAMLPYLVQYVCLLPDHKEVVGETRVYSKDNHVAIVTDFERIDGDLLARTKESVVLLTLPPGTFKNGGTYEVTLVGRLGSKRWNVQVH
jgi:hypothetical protein